MMYSDRVDSVTRATNPSPLSLSPSRPPTLSRLLPLPFACRPLLRHLPLRRNHHCRYLLLLLLLLFLFFATFASFCLSASTCSDASACKARSRSRTGLSLSFSLSIFPQSTSRLVLSFSFPFLSFPVALTTISLDTPIRRILLYRFCTSTSPYLSVFAVLSVSLSLSLSRISRGRVSRRRLRRYTEICMGVESRAQKESETIEDH